MINKTIIEKIQEICSILADGSCFAEDGNCPPKYADLSDDKCCGVCSADKIHVIYESLGYVQKDPDQSLPKNPNLGIPTFYAEYKQCQQDMLEAGWVKVLKE